MGTGSSRSDRRAATAARILDAAQVEFGAHGEGATVRGIARRAGVDPSLVLQHYGSKQSLFALAVRPASDLKSEDVTSHLVEVLDLRLRELPAATRALMRSMLTSPEAAAVMRDYLQERAKNLAGALEGEHAELRAALIVSSILGITVARHLLDLPMMRELDGDTVASITADWFTPLT